MPLLVPAGSATFGDATTTAGGALCHYILAQFRDTAQLDWVQDIRAALGVPELKYKVFESSRQRLRADKQLWSRVENGVGQASIIVIDPQPTHDLVKSGLEADGAQLDVDYRSDDLIKRTATALIGNTPVAYFPAEILHLVIDRAYALDTFDRFTPEAIQQRIGPSLRAAKVFAARAFAAWDVPSASNHDVLKGTWHSPAARLVLAEVLATARVFDNENKPSVIELNNAADEITRQLSASSDWLMLSRPLVQEADSKNIDHIQAADIAAGWARDVIDMDGPLALGRKFERVWINGTKVK